MILMGWMIFLLKDIIMGITLLKHFSVSEKRQHTPSEIKNKIKSKLRC